MSRIAPPPFSLRRTEKNVFIASDHIDKIILHLFVGGFSFSFLSFFFRSLSLSLSLSFVWQLFSPLSAFRI